MEMSETQKSEITIRILEFDLTLLWENNANVSVHASPFPCWKMDSLC